MSEHPAYVRHQIVVPVVHNEEAGSSPRSVDQHVLLEIQRDVIDVTGGATVAGPEGGTDGPRRSGTSSLVGMWVGEDKAFREPVLTITADGEVAKDGAVLAIHRFLFHTIAERIGRELEQESVYYTYHDVERWLIPPPKEREKGPEWVLVLVRDAGAPRPHEERGSSDWGLRAVGVTKWGDTNDLPANPYLVGLSDRFLSRHFEGLFEQKRPREFRDRRGSR